MIQLRFITFLFVLMLTQVLFGQAERKFIRKGNAAYESGNFEDAETAYQEGLEKNNYSYEANYNLGNTYYQKGAFDQALIQYGVLANPEIEGDKLAKYIIILEIPF